MKLSRCPSPNHLAGLCYLGKSLQTGKSEGHVSLQLKEGVWVHDLLWDPNFTTGTIQIGKLGDLYPSGTRTRSQEVNYRPKLFHQLVRHHNSVPMQVELCSSTWAIKPAGVTFSLGQGSLPTRARSSHEASGDLEKNCLWSLLGWVAWTPLNHRTGEPQKAFSCFMLIRWV